MENDTFHNDSDVEDASNCSSVVPSSREMLQLYIGDRVSLSILVICTIVCALTCILFVETAMSLGKQLQYGTRRGNTIFLLGLVPVHSVTSLASIYIPKAALISTWAASVYLAVSLYVFLMLIFNYFGGPQQMVVELATKEISLAQAPLACCCPCCCVKIRITIPNLHRLRAAVLQQSVFQPLILFVTAILWADDLYNPSDVGPQSPYMYLTAFILISTLVAMYALTVINIAANKTLSATYGSFRVKFNLIKMFMLVPSLQNLVITMLAQSNVIPCRGILSSSIRGTLLFNFLIIIEVFLLLVIGRLLTFCKKKPLHQAGQNASLSRVQANHHYAGIPEVSSPLWDCDGKPPVFPMELVDLKEKNHNEDISESPSRSRGRQKAESDV